MNIDKYIFIVEPTEEQLNSGLQELANLYADTGYTENIILLKSLKVENRYIVNFKNTPDFERFKYFVNFLQYPIETEYTAKVMGFWTVDKSDQIPGHMIDKRLLLYVSEKDTAGDSVFAIYSGAESTVKFGFALGEEYQELGSKEFEFAEPKLNEKEYNVINTISPDMNNNY